eukprot:2822300-Prymnesium_polylepis.1
MGQAGSRLAITASLHVAQMQRWPHGTKQCVRSSSMHTTQHESSTLRETPLSALKQTLDWPEPPPEELNACSCSCTSSKTEASSSAVRSAGGRREQSGGRCAVGAGND